MTPEQREALEYNYCGPYASTTFPAVQVRAALAEIKRLEGVIAIAKDEWTTCNAVLEATKEDLEVARRDIGDLLRAAGLGDHARPISPHQVVQAVLLPCIAQLVVRQQRLHNALAQISLTEADSTSSVVEKVQSMARIARDALRPPA